MAFRRALTNALALRTSATSQTRRFAAAAAPHITPLRTRPSYTISKRWASSVSASSSVDPTDRQINDLLSKGIENMAASDLDGAKQAFERSIEIRETPAALYNLALTQYQLGQLPQCIKSFERSLELQPSADAHTNVASAFILSTPPMPVKAIEHLQKALELAPSDGEINFNMGVIFEATDRLEDALKEYTRAKDLGIERAAQCIRNVGGKIVERKRQAAGSNE